MDSGIFIGCLLGMVEAPMLKCTCNPSAAAGGRTEVCSAPFQTTLSVKSVRFEKRPKNNKKSTTRLCQLWQPNKDADVHDPRGSQKNFMQESFGLIFCSFFITNFPRRISKVQKRRTWPCPYFLGFCIKQARQNKNHPPGCEAKTPFNF